MVGIVLASHGGFADGIFQSAEMIFGKQENLAHVILKPDEVLMILELRWKELWLLLMIKIKYCF